MATERIRIVVQTDGELRAALKMEAARQGVDMSELADSILREALAEALKAIQAVSKKKPKKGES